MGEDAHVLVLAREASERPSRGGKVTERGPVLPDRACRKRGWAVMNEPYRGPDENKLKADVAMIGEAWHDSPYYVDAERWTFLFWRRNSSRSLALKLSTYPFSHGLPGAM